MNFASPFVLALNRGRDDESADTNIVSAKFDHLVEPCNAYTGDSYKCNNCDAFLSKISKISLESSNMLDGKRIWTCEFCNFENKIQISDDEIPKEDQVTYLIEPASSHQTSSSNVEQSQYLIYCIDISGSMSITTQVNGNFKLPTDQIRRESLQSHLDGDLRAMPLSRFKHISRLECVQLAIDENLKKLEKNSPEKRVGIVAFNKSVIALGDGSIDLIDIRDDHVLESKDEIKKVADRTPEFGTIGANMNKIRDKLLRLEEGGATALGPALYYSILIASRKTGSQVILCTDGLANRGLGSLENTNKAESDAFYHEIADLALQNGVSVSIITLEGTSCKLGILGEIADKTSGNVNVVNPLKLKDEFSSILEEAIIGVNVSVSLILHKALYIRDYEDLNNKLSSIKKQIGNVTSETEITFEFALRDDAQIDINKEKQLPFQLQIVYNALDGSKLNRILTQMRMITKERKMAEESSDRNIIASHYVQTKSKLMQRNFKQSNAVDKFSSYIRNLTPAREDNFSTDNYNAVERDLVIVNQQQQQQQQQMEFSKNGRSKTVPSFAKPNSNLVLCNSSAIPGALPDTASACLAVKSMDTDESNTASNMFAELDDDNARKGYRLNKISSKFMKK